jgi:4-hydroxy-L-threonine phosphate dehydrogenase PdxA
VFARGCGVAGTLGAYPEIASLAAARTATGPWSFLDRPFAAAVTPIGRVSAEAGREALETISMLATASLAGEIDGIVYAPLNKEAMRDAGHAAGDEAEYFAQCFKHRGPIGEINILGEVWTSRVTSHVPLREVGDLITRENVLRGIRLLAGALQRAGKVPRLAVSALNPHAGEGGAFGREEIDVLVPAIAEARAEGLDIAGPFPSDTVFPRAVGGAFNGVVTMFHDQGQIALKMVGLGEGITLLGGFPVPIATPGHGTAFDIAGKGTAKAGGLAAAIGLVSRMMNKDSVP